MTFAPICLDKSTSSLHEIFLKTFSSSPAEPTIVVPVSNPVHVFSVCASCVGTGFGLWTFVSLYKMFIVKNWWLYILTEPRKEYSKYSEEVCKSEFWNFNLLCMYKCIFNRSELVSLWCWGCSTQSTHSYSMLCLWKHGLQKKLNTVTYN